MESSSYSYTVGSEYEIIRWVHGEKMLIEHFVTHFSPYFELPKVVVVFILKKKIVADQKQLHAKAQNSTNIVWDKIYRI